MILIFINLFSKKIMITGIFLVLYFGLVCTPGVLADNNHEIKRGDHPYMAFIYFLDPSIVDLTGSRFIRSAILIRPEWLVTSALGPHVIDTPNGFPKQTLMARVGAISIDANITLMEEEFEQEREVVQVLRPFNNSATQWWTTDISLLKTLLPFNLTSTVGVTTINTKRTFEETKTCIILFYSQLGNSTEKQMMKMFVDLLPSSSLNCGTHFSPNTMICASDSEENKDTVYDPNFCQGNSGGPLICENDIMGLQTYIDNDCKPPHLYQLLSTWDNFITCSIEVKCHEEQCANICDVTYKDPPIITTEQTEPFRTEEIKNISESSDGEATSTDNPNPLNDLPTQTIVISSLETTENVKIDDFSQATTTTSASTTTTSTTTTEAETTTQIPTEETTEEATKGATEDITEAENNTSWPKEIATNLKSSDMESDNVDVHRQEQVVAQQQKNNKKHFRSQGSPQRNGSILLSLISGVMILVCLN